MTTSTTHTMTLIQALRYPFGGRGWLRRLLMLALVQLIPVFGQLILIGYGLTVARAVHMSQTGLPPIHWFKALTDGAKLVIVGLLYGAPALAILPLILTAGTNTPGGGPSMDIGQLVVTLGLTLTITAVVGRLRIENKKVKRLVSTAVSIVPIIAIVSLVANVSRAQFDFSLDMSHLNSVGIVMTLVFALLICVIFIGLQLVGVRYAVQGRGLIDPVGGLRLLLQDRALTVLLTLNLILLLVLEVVLVSVGLVLLVVPGLFALVVCALAQWYLWGCFARDVGLKALPSSAA